QPGASLRPKRGGHACGSSAPVVAGQHRARHVQRVHEGDHIGPDSGLLTGTWRGAVEETCRSVPPQIGALSPGSRGALTCLTVIVTSAAAYAVCLTGACVATRP